MGCKNVCVLVNYLTFILIQSQLWSHHFCQRVPGYTISTLSNVKVQQGLCLHVPCSFTVPSDIQLPINTTAVWYRGSKNAPELIASKNNKGNRTNGRFFMTGDVARGDCSYYIEDPIPSDTDRYFFRIVEPIKFTFQDVEPNIVVTELTDKPTISSPRLVEGKEVTLTCMSPGRCQNIKPRISWDGKMSGMRKKTYNKTYEDGSQTFHSSIKFIPRMSDHRSSISCRATFNRNVTTVAKQILNVEYSPFMDINIEGAETDDITDINDTTTVTVKDGDSITLKCIVDSNPNAAITWYKEDKMVQRTSSNQTLTLINITNSDARIFHCSAENEHGGTHRMVVIIGLRKARQKKKPPSTETESPYTELKRSEMSSIYAQLKPENLSDPAVVGSDEDPSHDYENVQRRIY
ncbi:sialic acid-binding Ig-like lectin 14 [Leptodactylus fuscus]|uniref:sialic acid-binding Ig-like lectin 14 n=1 Tax=Leptodactylus fuscus TaxID=238119 RepID=UPI003F4E6F65